MWQKEGVMSAAEAVAAERAHLVLPIEGNLDAIGKNGLNSLLEIRQYGLTQ